MGLGVPLSLHFVSFYKSILLLFVHKMGSMFPIVFYQHLLQSEFSIWNMGHQYCKQYSRRGFSSVSHSALNSCKSPLDIPSLLSISQDFVDVFHGLIILAVLYDVVIYWKTEGSSPTLPILVSIEETSSRHKIKSLIHILPKWAQYFGPFKFLAKGFGSSMRITARNSVSCFLFKSTLPLYRVNSWFLNPLQGLGT